MLIEARLSTPASPATPEAASPAPSAATSRRSQNSLICATQKVIDEQAPAAPIGGSASVFADLLDYSA
jgi:hypothetical protein